MSQRAHAPSSMEPPHTTPTPSATTAPRGLNSRLGSPSGAPERRCPSALAEPGDGLSQRPSKTSLGTSRQAVARPLQRCLRTSRRASERPTPRGLPRRSTRVRHRPPRRPATRRQSARAAAAENVSGATLGSPSTPSANTLPEALANQLDTVALRPADYVSESLAGALGALRHTLRESPSDVSAGPSETPRRSIRHPCAEVSETACGDPSRELTETATSPATTPRRSSAGVGHGVPLPGSARRHAARGRALHRR